jgi:hypothetical protein
MAKSQEIAQIEEIYKGLTSVDGIVNKLSDSYLKLVKTIDDGTKSTKDNATTLEDLINKQKQTTDESKKQDTLDKQLAASEAKLIQLEDGRVKQLIAKKIAIQEKNKALLNEVKAEGLAETSLVRMRLKLAELTKAYDQSGTRTKAAADEINKLSREIGKAEATTNRHQRGVGGYADQLGGLPGPVGRAASSITNFTTKLSSIGPAGASIAGIILAISAPLVAFFTKSEKGAELLERKISGLKAAFSVLTGELISGGEKMSDAFEKPEKKASHFWQFLMSVFGPAWSDVGMSMDIASESMEKYTLGMQQLEDLERGMIVPRAEANLKIKEARLLYADETKSIEVRIAALQTALDLENKVTDDEIANQNRKILLLSIANDEKKKAGQFRDEDDKAMQEAIARGIELETESAGRKMRVARTITTAKKELLKDEVDAEKKKNEEIKKAQDEFNAYWDKIDKEEAKAADEKWNSEVDFQRQLFKSNREAAKTEWDAKQEEAKELKKLQEDLEKDILETKKEFLNEAMDSLFTINENANNNKIDQLEEQKERELDNEKLTADQKKEINDKYEKQENAIKKRQKIANKLESAIEVGIKTARTVFELQAEAAILLSNPITAALAPMALAQIPWVLGMSALSLASIAAYKKGTLSAKDKFIAGESGRELMFLKSGDVGIVEKPTYFEGSKFKGAKIFSNPETEKMIGMTDRKIGGYQITDERLLNKMDEVKKAILNKPVNIIDRDNRVIGQATSHSQTIYLNKLLHRN